MLLPSCLYIKIRSPEFNTQGEVIANVVIVFVNYAHSAAADVTVRVSNFNETVRESNRAGRGQRAAKCPVLIHCMC